MAQSVVYIKIKKKNAFHVWNDLKEIFSQGDLFRIAELQE